MRFVPYHELNDSTPNIIVDGAAGPGTVLTLSHWPKSGTPEALKRDTFRRDCFCLPRFAGLARGGGNRLEQSLR